MDFDSVFIVGFIMLCIYKVFELFVRRKERMLLVEKLASLSGNEEDNEKPIKLQLPFIYTNDSNSWALRISLLLIGIGVGCLVALYIQMNFYSELSLLNYNHYGTFALINFACISLFGGIGLLIAFFIEQKKKVEKKD